MKTFKELRSVEEKADMSTDLSSHSDGRLRAIASDPKHPHYAAAKAELNGRAYLRRFHTAARDARKKKQESK